MKTQHDTEKASYWSKVKVAKTQDGIKVSYKSLTEVSLEMGRKIMT